MRVFIVLCLVAAACADHLPYNYHPVDNTYIPPGGVSEGVSFGVASNTGPSFAGVSSEPSFVVAGTGSSFDAASSGPAFVATSSVPSFAATSSGSSFVGTNSGPSFAATSTGPSAAATSSGPAFTATSFDSSFVGTSSGPSVAATSSGPAFTVTSSGPSFAASSSGPSFDGASSGPSFVGASSGPAFVATSTGPSFVASSSGPSFVATSTGPSFAATSVGSDFGASQGGFEAASHGAPVVSGGLEKEFYTFTADEQDFNDAAASDQNSNTLKQGLRVIFIKGPENSGLENAALALAKQTSEQKTDIYVLSKQADISGLTNKLNNENSNTNNKPEVHFVKYRTQEDAANAQKTIQSEYEALGGQSQYFNGGVASSLNFASHAPAAAAVVAGGHHHGSVGGGAVSGSTGAAGGNTGSTYLPASVLRLFRL